MSTKTKTVELDEEDLINARKALAKNKAKQEKLREEELEIRTFLADALHDGDEGSKTIKIGNTKVTIKRTINRTITKDDAERLAQEHGEISVECLSWSPSVKVSGYKEHQAIMDEYITTRPGPPVVEFKD